MTHRFLPLALLLLCLAISCGKNEIEITPPEEPTPVEPVDPVDPPKTEEWTIDNDTSAPILGAVMLDVSGRNKEQEDMGDHSRNVYSARHIMEVAGMPFVSTKSLEQAMSQSRLILISSAVRANTFTPDELIRLRQWVEEGGALIAPAVTAISAEVEALFGISHSSYLKTRHYASWLDEVMTDAELAYMDEPEEKDFSLGGEKEEQVIKTYGYTLSTAHALARFNTGEVAVS